MRLSTVSEKGDDKTPEDTSEPEHAKDPDPTDSIILPREKKWERSYSETPLRTNERTPDRLDEPRNIYELTEANLGDLSRCSMGRSRKSNEPDGELSTWLLSVLTHGCGSATLGDMFRWT